MDPDDITENIMTVLEFIEAKIKKPIESVCKVYIKTTMGEPVEVVMR
jgi:ribosomal protein L1